MIEIKCVDGHLHWRPEGDSIPFRTWRRPGDRPRYHTYPTRGLHGAPMPTRECLQCRAGKVLPKSMRADYFCGNCNGSRVLVDAPERTDGP